MTEVNNAVVVPRLGDIDVLEYRQMPVPEILSDEILVRAEYGGMNYIDNYFRAGVYKVQTPYVAGSEGAGTVVKTGSAVTKFVVGDRVAYTAPNTFATYVVLKPANRIARIPDGIDTKTAAAAFLQGLTTITLINEAYKVQKNDFVVVIPAAGGCGLLLTQLCSAIGAHVIAVVGSDDKAALAKSYGAEYTINYSTEDIASRVSEFTDGLGAQVVYDGVGKATAEASFASVRRKGTLVLFGNASGVVPPVDILRLSAKNIKLLRPTLTNYIATDEELSYYSKLLFDSILAGSLKITIFKVYPLTEYKAAVTDFVGRKTTGKLVVEIQ
ncbi:uncharacterized protein V1510DRAFT_366514 [Dipodascopsis tothii]|uniref:uncharacterized protein n=1 Tax=Dipodascopsis tothii TaxID=44089 RepID=UPI0034CEF095